MNRQKPVIFVIALGMIAVTAGALVHLKANQQLGRPGVKGTAIAGSPRMNLYLPERVLDYASTNIPTDPGLLEFMPHDTSFAQRRYTAPDRFQTVLNIVLMGTDRSSIHKPQFCLTGNGYTIDDAKSGETRVPMLLPRPYELPVKKLLTSREARTTDGRSVTAHGVFVYWFVADGQLTAGHGDRMWRMAKELLRSGVLERWAYVICFSECWPGEEEQTYRRMVTFMQAAVPQFQLVAGPDGGGGPAQTASR
jgi:hypothetical protein